MGSKETIAVSRELCKNPRSLEEPFMGVFQGNQVPGFGAQTPPAPAPAPQLRDRSRKTRPLEKGWGQEERSGATHIAL